MFQSINFRKSAALKPRKSFYLSRSQIEDQTDSEILKPSDLGCDKEEFFKRIIEFLKSESRTVPQDNQITEYLLSLTNLASVFSKIQSDELSQHIFLYNITKSLKFEFFQKNEMLMKYGEPGLKFYFLLKGAADIIVPKWQTVYLTEENYLEYLMRLKVYGENDFLQKTLTKNKKYSHLNKKALNDFVFEEVKKIKNFKDFDNLSEEHQMFFRDLVLKVNSEFADWRHFTLNNSFNFANKKSFNFEKNKNQENENYFCEGNLNKNSKDREECGIYLSNNKKDFGLNKNLKSFETKNSQMEGIFGINFNLENPEKIFFPRHNHSSNFLNKLQINSKESIRSKASNLSLRFSTKDKWNLDLNQVFNCEKSEEKIKLLNLIRIEKERKKSIIHLKEILDSHWKAAAAAPFTVTSRGKESYFYNPKSKLITTEEYINRIKPRQAMQIKNTFDIDNSDIYRIPSNVNTRNYNYISSQIDKANKEFKILLYYHVKTIDSGDVFGQMALLKNEGKRNATLIATEDCYLGVLDKNTYNMTLQEHENKRLNQDINLFIKGPIFSSYPKMHFFKNVFNLFESRKIDKGTLIAREGDVSDSLLFLKEGLYEVRVKCSLADVDKIIKSLGGKVKSVNNEEEYMLDNDDLKEYMNKKLEMKVLLINQANVIGFRDFVIGNKFLFTVECISNIGNAFYIKRDVFHEVAYEGEKLIKKNIKEYEKLKIEKIIERLRILKNSYIDIFLRRKKLPTKQNVDELTSFLQETKYQVAKENYTNNQAENNALIANNDFNNSKNKNNAELDELSKTEKKYSFWKNSQIPDYSSYGEALVNKREKNLSASNTNRKENIKSFSSNKINIMNKFEFSPIKKRNLNIHFSNQVFQTDKSPNKINENIKREHLRFLSNLKSTVSKDESGPFPSINNDQYPQIKLIKMIENHELNKKRNILKPNSDRVKLNSDSDSIKPDINSKQEIFPKLNNYLGNYDSNKNKEQTTLPLIRSKAEMESINNKKDFPVILKVESEVEKLQKLLVTNSNRVIGSKVKFGFNEINRDELDFEKGNSSKHKNAKENVNKITEFSGSLKKNEPKTPTTSRSNFEPKSSREAMIHNKKHFKSSRKIFSKSLIQKNLLRNSDVKLKKEIQMLEVDIKITNLSKLKKRKKEFAPTKL